MADYLIIAVVLIGGITMLCVPKKDRYRTWAWAIVAGVTALLFAKIVSLFYQGQRPFEALGVDPGAAFLPNPGFPSDHALLVFAVTGIVWASTKNKTLGMALLFLSMLVGVGRVLALVHTPIDVLGGIVCAAAACAVIYGKRFFTTRT